MGYALCLLGIGDRMTYRSALHRGLLAATSAFALTSVGVNAQSRADLHVVDEAAQGGAFVDIGTLSDDQPGVITRDDVPPNVPAPAGSLDSGVNGVGQMAVRGNPATFGLGLCTGTLINPRTVIFAAHCVNTRPDTAYGSPTGGTPISFGFNADNRPAVRRWLGLDGGTAGVTDQAFNIYNVEQVWYDPRSLDGGFLQADVAIATLDTPAFDIPTWAMLFTPLDGQEHVTVTGYGGNGTSGTQVVGTSPPIDFRRRIAENYVSFLGSLADRNQFLFGDREGDYEQNLYMSSFSDPAGTAVYNPAQRRFDFGLFGADDVPLPREGVTAGGDSGGPLILDQKYNIPLIIGVLSGGSRFFGAQPFGSYGSHSFYQPLHSFWDVIVANNPYVYATTKGGNGQWTDPGHWIQAMDPNYYVALNGQLINRLPDAPGEGVSGTGAKFGDVCFLADCQDFTRAGEETADGPDFFVAGGPGTENFVPNNVTANPRAGVKARYFDVTLAALGSTTLSGADITIDKLTVSGITKLDIARDASLRVLGDYTHGLGWTNVDGTLAARETFLLNGVLSGSGTLRTPFFTSVAGIVAPGGQQRFGTLTIDGNAILASASTLFIEANRNGADKLAVTGTLSLSDPSNAGAGGATLIIARAPGAAPRFGQSFTIAEGSKIEGRFGNVYASLGVLRPELTYTDTAITANLRAGRLSDLLSRGSLTATAFAVALDALRDRSYASLANLYGSIDLMDGATLDAALSSLAPRSNEQGRMLSERQSNALFGVVTDRLSTMGTGGAATGTLSIVGSPLGVIDRDGATRAAQITQAGFAGLSPDRRQVASLPEGVSGFVSGGVIAARGQSFSSDRIEDGARSTYFGMGLEHEVARDLVLGIAAGHASGLSNGGSDQARSTLDQVAVYGSYQVGGGAYLGFAANMEQAKLRTSRLGFGLNGGSNLFGEQDASRLTAVTEAGVNLSVTRGLTLTPRVQLGYGRAHLSNLTETGGDAALAIDEVTTQRVDAKVGMKLAGTQSLGNGWTFIPQIQADYVRLLDGADSGLDVRFAAADDFVIALPIAGGDRSWGEVKGGLAIGNRTVQFGAGFETSVGRSELRNDRAVADVTIRF